jgi:hypothetical protein
MAFLAAYDTDVAAVRARIDHLLSLVEQTGLTSFGEREERRSVAVARVAIGLFVQRLRLLARRTAASRTSGRCRAAWAAATRRSHRQRVGVQPKGVDDGLAA